MEETLTFIRNSKHRPFFLYLPFTLPHTELAAPEDMVAAYRNKFDEVPLKAMYGRPPVKEPKAVYTGMIATMDRDVGKITDLLKQLNLDDNTLIIGNYSAQFPKNLKKPRKFLTVFPSENDFSALSRLCPQSPHQAALKGLEPLKASPA